MNELEVIKELISQNNENIQSSIKELSDLTKEWTLSGINISCRSSNIHKNNQGIIDIISIDIDTDIEFNIYQNDILKLDVDYQDKLTKEFINNHLYLSNINYICDNGLVSKFQITITSIVHWVKNE